MKVFEQVVEKLMGSGRTGLICSRRTLALGLFLEFYMNQLNKEVVLLFGEPRTIDLINRFGPGDTVVGIGFARYSRITVKSLEYAKKIGEAVIVSAVRTAIGSFNGSLRDVPAVRLGEIAIRAAIESEELAADQVEEVIMGNVLQSGIGHNPARQAAVGAGIPVGVPSFTVNKVCGSGQRLQHGHYGGKFVREVRAQPGGIGCLHAGQSAERRCRH